VVAQGTPLVSYQWQFNGTNITGATDAVLSLASWDSEGSYSVIVSNAYGAVVSSNVTLTLLRSQIVAWGQDYDGQTNTPAGLGNVFAVAAGGDNSMALKSDGTVAVWGDNPYGQTNVPSGLSNVVAISCGSFYDCLALKSDGTAVGWGYNSFGKASVPAGLSNIVAIAAGVNHSMVLQSGGNVIVWGSNSSGQTNVPSGLSNVIAIAAGSDHCLALRADGTVVAWGDNFSGQTNVPVSLTNVMSIAACGHDSLALQSNGVVTAWGDNSFGQTNVPATLTNAIAIAAGAWHNIALLPDGTAIAWGDNGSGQTDMPFGLSQVVAVAAGQFHSLALLNDGPPLIASQPAGQTVYAGFPISMTANVLGLHPIAFQWLYDGTNINGATNAVLMLPNIQPTNAGNYSFVVSNAFGMAVSSNATLTVLTNPPIIVVQPANQIGIAGSNVTFSVGVGPGPIPNTYQWLFNGTNIASGTNSALTLTSIQTSNQGSYSVVVNNGYGTATGSNAYLTVIVLDLPTALNTPGWTWTNTGNAAWFPEASVTRDGSFAAQSGVVANNQKSTLQTSVTGPGTLTFWWRFSDQSFDSLGFYVNGSLLASSSFGFDWQQKTFYFGSGVQTLQWTYTRSFFPFGSMGTGWVDQVSFTPGFSSPIVLTPPQDREAPAGTNVTFQVTAVGTPPLSYQWQFGGTNISGAISSSFTVNDVQTNNAGDYTLIVSNNYGITNVNAVLLVDPSSPAITIQPASQKLPTGNAATFSSGASGSEPIFYLWQHNNVDIGGATNASLLISSLQPSDAGSYHLVASNAFGFATSSDAILTLYSLLDLATSVNALGLNWTTFGNATWFPQTNTTHDGISAAQSGQLGFAQSSSLQTTVIGPGTLTFWWKVSCYNSTYVGMYFSVNGAGQATIQGEVDWQQKSYYLGEGTQTLLWVYFNNTSATSGQNAGWVDQVSFTPGGTPPTATSMSPNTYIRASGSTNFVVSAFGTPPLAYQWQLDGTNLLSKTNASLSLANVQPTNAGIYTVVITNNFGVIATNTILWVGLFKLNAGPTNSFMSTNGFKLELDGILTTNPVVIFASTDLVYWLPLFTNSATTGSVQFWDVIATNIPTRFYRARE
jgi:alpha-tubulin suppressor-like RCC1 family protein